MSEASDRDDQTAAAGIEVRHRHDLYSDLASRVDAKDPAFATHGCFVCKSLRASLPAGASPCSAARPPA